MTPQVLLAYALVVFVMALGLCCLILAAVVRCQMQERRRREREIRERYFVDMELE